MKKERTKSFISGILFSVFIFSMIGTAAATIGSRTLTADYTDINIQLDGKQLTPTDANGNAVEPFAINGTTYLPVRAVSNALGLGVEWDSESKTVVLSSPKSPNRPFEIHDCYENFSVPAFENVIGYDALVDVYELSTGDSVLYTYDPAYFDYSIVDDYLIAYMNLLDHYGFKRDTSKETDMSFFYQNPISGIMVDIIGDNETDLIYLLIMSIYNTDAPTQVSPSNQINTSTPTQTGQGNASTSQDRQKAYLAEVANINSYYDAQISALERERDKAAEDAYGAAALRTGGLGGSAATAAKNQVLSEYNAKIKDLKDERDAAISDAKIKYGQ